MNHVAFHQFLNFQGQPGEVVITGMEDRMRAGETVDYLAEGGQMGTLRNNVGPRELGGLVVTVKRGDGDFADGIELADQRLQVGWRYLISTQSPGGI
jgi:hypothetical protein